MEYKNHNITSKGPLTKCNAGGDGCFEHCFHYSE